MAKFAESRPRNLPFPPTFSLHHCNLGEEHFAHIATREELQMEDDERENTEHIASLEQESTLCPALLLFLRVGRQLHMKMEKKFMSSLSFLLFLLFFFF